MSIPVLLRVLKSVSNKRRLKMLEVLLKHKELSLAKISKVMNIPISSACRNLKILEANLMVKHRLKKGKVYYSLNPARPLRFNRAILKLIKKQRKRYKY